MTFTADSSLASQVVPSLGFRRGKYEKRSNDVVAWIVHTTGYGPIRRFKNRKQRAKHGWETPFDAALFIYQHIMNAGPQWLVGQRLGEIAQLCPEDRCAWHVGGRGGGRYRKLRWVNRNSKWWPDVWEKRGFTSPTQFADDRIWLPYKFKPSLRVRLSSLAGSVNANTLGLEVVPNLDDPFGAWTDDCWANILKLTTDRASAHSFRLECDTLVRHSDVHPVKRSRRNQPWDTWDDQFTWEEFERRVIETVPPIWYPGML